MTKLTTLARAAAVATTLLAGALGSAPVFAAAADIALLKEYIGSWKGRGTLTGANTETVVCRLTFTEGNEDKINYAGRCTLAGTNLSINGTIAYIDATRRYEASMTSDIGFSPDAVVGRKQGSGILFSMRERQEDGEGNPMTVTAAMRLSPDKINVEFNVVFNETGDTISAQVPFTK